MNILGISSYYHDSAAAILVDGQIVAAAQEERFSRKKHDAGFPEKAIRYCLEEADLELSMVDQVVFYDKPFLKFERLLETYYNYSPRGIASFVTAIPVWISEKLFLKRNIRKGLKAIADFDTKQQPLLFPEHHLSHAASAFYPSPFKEAVIVTVDGVGEWATASICQGKENQIRIVSEMHFPHSVGLLYSAFTYYLGFRVNSGEYKLMGLAPYGDPESKRVEQFISDIKTNLVRIHEDGSIWLDQKWYRYATGLRMTANYKWEKLFGIPRRNEKDPIEQVHCDLALAIQQVTEEVVMKLVTHAKSLAETELQAENLCLAGGVALNCVANGKLKESGIFKNIFIQPAAGDAGGALGAALAAHHIYNGEKRIVNPGDSMQGTCLGPAFGSRDVLKMIRKFKARAEEITDFKTLSTRAAELIDQGNVVGWFQGRMEFGPRALGNRSILADARSPEMQKKLNLKVKYREGFRPFAPSVLEECTGDYFEYEGSSPYMLMVAQVKKERQHQVPGDYFSLPYMDRLYVQRSELPAITHIDFSARLQTVHRETNPRYWGLISEFRNLTGCGVIINTSFNVRGEPIVCTPEDAYRCFMRTEMDYLVVGDHLLKKEDQPAWEEKDWRKKVGTD
ncbi:MAG: carbamoyltransferase [Bacteroidetes bacterium]|nr:carbamoyltransferase [Bacteroidota bacterium]